MIRQASDPDERDQAGMTNDLVRFGVAIDSKLLERFDARIAKKGYANRSEALLDLIRADLVDELAHEGSEVTGTLTLVFDHHIRELTERLTTFQHNLGHHVIATLHVHLDLEHCLEVIVMRGIGSLLQQAAERLLAVKGVQGGRLILTGLPTTPAATAHEHGPATHTHDPAPKAGQKGKR